MEVLVVEDEELVREIVTEGLLSDGLEVSAASSAEAALELAQTKGPPEVLITDIHLGAGMNGLDLVQEVHRRWPAAGVIIMTGTPDAVRAHSFGDRERFLSKPFGNVRMVSAVRELMNRPER